MASNISHSVAMVTVGLALFVGCASKDDTSATTSGYNCGNGGASAATTTDGATTDATSGQTVATGGQTVSTGGQQQAAQSTNAASSTVAMAASGATSGGGGGTCDKATCNGANCCCTFMGTSLCIGAAMCQMGGGTCQ